MGRREYIYIYIYKSGQGDPGTTLALGYGGAALICIVRYLLTYHTIHEHFLYKIIYTQYETYHISYGTDNYANDSCFHNTIFDNLFPNESSPLSPL